MSSGSPARISTSAQFVPIDWLQESQTNPRKRFDQRSLDELAESIRDRGVLQPLLVRNIGSDAAPAAEIVAGARRYRAAKLAGLSEVPVTVRDMSDDEAVMIQLVENGQREDLTPIEEAEAYAALYAKGLTIPQIANEVRKRASAVAKRLPLANLPKRVKDAMAAGYLPVGHAELIARIRDPELQEEALGRILEDFGGGERAAIGAVPYAVAKRTIEEHFMFPLSAADFNPEDATLSPLGPCRKCPHLSGNSPNLFGDVKRKDVCTNPKDFRVKTEAHLRRLKESGYTVLLTPKEVKRAFPSGESNPHHIAREFVDLEAVCGLDPKGRTYEALLVKDLKLKTVYVLLGNRVRRLYPAAKVKEALIASGHAFAKEKKPRSATKAEASRSAARLERIGEEAVSSELAVKLRTVKLSPGGWIDLLLQIVLIDAHWKVEGVIRRHGFAGSKEEFATKRDEILKSRVESMTEAEKRAFLVDLLIGGWITAPDKTEREFYKHVLRLAGVDYAKVANCAIDEAKRKAVETKDTPKPPIAANTKRSAKPAKACGKAKTGGAS